MSEQNISIKFYLNSHKTRAGKNPIYTRIISNRRKVEMATDFFIHKKEWNSERQRVRKNIQLNESLAEIERGIYDTIYKIKKENKFISADSIKAHYTGKEQLEVSILNFFDLYIDNLKRANELAESSVLRYKDTREHLANFIIEGKNFDLSFSKINFKFISEFDLYLLNQKSHRADSTLKRNTVNKHHTRFKTILIRAIKEGLLSKNPYNDFKIKYTPSNRTFLTHDELKKISDYSFIHNKTLDRVRDIFLFSVYTGLRFMDAQNLKTNQIVIDKQNKYFITVTQEKTKEQIQIPLLLPAVNIFKKYDNEERKITNKVLPKISNQKLNSYLKEIANIVGIEKNLSHHIARHTCATTVLLSNEAPIEIVSKWLGHNNIRTTQIYAKITNEYLRQVAKKIESKIN